MPDPMAVPGHDYYRAWWLSTVGVLACVLVLVGLWYAVQRALGEPADKAYNTAVNLSHFGVFLWYPGFRLGC